MKVREIQDEILRMKKENDVCILAHSYQKREIVEVAGLYGDKLGINCAPHVFACEFQNTS